MVMMRNEKETWKFNGQSRQNSHAVHQRQKARRIKKNNRLMLVGKKYWNIAIGLEVCYHTGSWGQVHDLYKNKSWELLAEV